jgi:hypothetical protein
LTFDAPLFSIIGLLFTPLSVLILLKGSGKFHRFAQILLIIGFITLSVGIILPTPLNAIKIINRIAIHSLIGIIIYFIFYITSRRVFLADNDLLISSRELIKYTRIIFPNYNPSVHRLRIHNILMFLCSLIFSLFLLSLIFKIELFFILLLPFIYILDLFGKIPLPAIGNGPNELSNFSIICIIVGWLIGATGLLIYKFKKSVSLFKIRVIVISGFALFFVGLINVF